MSHMAIHHPLAIRLFLLGFIHNKRVLEKRGVSTNDSLTSQEQFIPSEGRERVADATSLLIDDVGLDGSLSVLLLSSVICFSISFLNGCPTPTCHSLVPTRFHSQREGAGENQCFCQ